MIMKAETTMSNETVTPPGIVFANIEKKKAMMQYPRDAMPRNNKIRECESLKCDVI
jgi:hypothetical protein